MANNCYFEMKIAGPEKSVEEFVKMLQHKIPGVTLGRIFSFDLKDSNDIEKDPKTGYIAVTGAGDCAWSLASALTENLPIVTGDLGIALEAFSSEPGACFQEHMLIVKDKVHINESVEYREFWIDGGSEADIQYVMETFNLTREELMEKLDHNGDYTVGGYDNFGEFDNLFSYLEPERKPSLVERISSAASRFMELKPGEKEKEPDREI